MVNVGINIPVPWMLWVIRLPLHTKSIKQPRNILKPKPFNLGPLALACLAQIWEDFNGSSGFKETRERSEHKQPLKLLSNLFCGTKRLILSKHNRNNTGIREETTRVNVVVVVPEENLGT